MTNFIPIFPLEIVVFPGEELNLHIHEPRYRQLIRECADHKKPFGIPSVLQDELAGFGTLVFVNEVFHTYNNGTMDITTAGDKVFRILEVIPNIPDKLYSGAIVHYPQNIPNGKEAVMQALLKKMRCLHALIPATKNFVKENGQLNVYDIAHYCGLTLKEEYELLQLTEERQRQEYLKRHFDKALPASAEIKTLKEKIQSNGHFKNLRSYFDM